MNKLVVSPSPHVHSGNSIQKEMKSVLIALIPAYLVALYYFGVGALIVSATSVLSCVLFEYLIQKFILKGEKTITDCSAIVTGLLLAFNLPSNLPIWIVIIGALVAIGVGKMSFGGLGNNPFNPALVGRVFLLISFPVQMTSWPRPIPFNLAYMDAETSATALTALKEHLENIPSALDMFIGNMGGSMGEVSTLALLLGFAYLLYRRTISWHIPITILFTVFVMTGIFYLVDPQTYASPLVHLMTGGLMLGAIFMATDFVTSPMTKRGMFVYGIGIGVITVVIRLFGSYPEGVSFAILIMNAFTPLINTYIKPKRFGEVRKK
ncbi:MAG TPA: RnfABCDGE type electron transport complex subunit D [Paludibacteraceae bacterium]|nr:RnfABCDGE type electron transport complex subunit D [Paludibacteraceae bacterium]HOH55366.1 RnfABCDGE type electron transport complex subunit D [Paludibacteraceae bacterium]